MDKKTDDEDIKCNADSGLLYKIGGGVLSGIYTVSSTGVNVVKSGSSMIYNNLPSNPWKKSSTDVNAESTDSTETRSSSWSFGFSKSKDKSD